MNNQQLIRQFAQKHKLTQFITQDGMEQYEFVSQDNIKIAICMDAIASDAPIIARALVVHLPNEEAVSQKLCAAALDHNHSLQKIMNAAIRIKDKDLVMQAIFANHENMSAISLKNSLVFMAQSVVNARKFLNLEIQAPIIAHHNNNFLMI